MTTLVFWMFVAFSGVRADAQTAGKSPPTAQSQQAGLAQEIAQALSEWLPGQLDDLDLPGAAVTVVDGRSTVSQQTYGHVEGPDSPRVDPETLFLLRSISKSVTVLAVLMAVEDGLLDLDTPIGEYVPGFTVNSWFGRDPAAEMTLRHMLSGRAGCTHDSPVDETFDEPGYFGRYIESISDTWLRFRVGYRFAYSNFVFDLVA
jgi:CubicO group peptidase (beta-lactamase class C family)